MSEVKPLTRGLHTLYEMSIIGKGIFALLDLLGAALLWILGPHVIAQGIILLSQGELLEDPNNAFAQLVLRAMNIPHPHVTVFAILYLFVHGSINAIFVIGLIREKLWAYPFAIISMGTFLCYQTYRLLTHPSPWMLALTIIDLCIIALIVREYRLHRHHAS
jgi:uncharacterized membrane protein